MGRIVKGPGRVVPGEALDARAGAATLLAAAPREAGGIPATPAAAPGGAGAGGAKWPAVTAAPGGGGGSFRGRPGGGVAPRLDTQLAALERALAGGDRD